MFPSGSGILAEAISFASTSLQQILYLSRVVFAMSAFAPIEISYSFTACNKSAAEA